MIQQRLRPRRPTERLIQEIHCWRFAQGRGTGPGMIRGRMAGPWVIWGSDLSYAI